MYRGTMPLIAKCTNRDMHLTEKCCDAGVLALCLLVAVFKGHGQLLSRMIIPLLYTAQLALALTA